MAFLASCQGISKSFSARPLFDGITIGISEGERLGLIGPNGTGKSTLLKIMAGEEKPDGGTVSYRRGLRMGYVGQADRLPEGVTVEGTLQEALKGLHLEPHERELRLEMLLAEVGFPDPKQAVGTLSGGWKKRLAIARELIREPDLILLDEPTNHLDLEGILWLEKVLRNPSFAYILVTHDRSFLQNVTNRVVELHPAYAEGYLSVNGNYELFLERREEYLNALANQQEALQNKMRRELEWLRATAPARSTKQNARIQAAGRLQSDLTDVRFRNNTGQTAGIDFHGTGRRTKDLVVAKGLAKRMGDQTLFSKLDFILSPGTRLGLIGANGSGKTTLLRLITGQLEPDAGEIKWADNLRIVQFDQSREQLNLDQPLKLALAPNGGDNVIYRDSPMHVAAWAKRFLFRTEQLEQSIRYMSGGEQARILIARLMLQPADLLVLDEPTNDLDIPTLEVLEESLAEFPGALVLVTHDRFMLDRLSTELLALDPKRGWRTFADYAQWEKAGWFGKREAEVRGKPAAAPVLERPRLTRDEQKELSRMESKIEEAEGKLEALKARMASPEVSTDHQKLQECWAQVGEAETKVAELYARWEELEAKRTATAATA